MRGLAPRFTSLAVSAACVLRVPLEGSVSQNFDSGISCYFTSKNGKLLVYFKNIIFYIT